MQQGEEMNRFMPMIKDITIKMLGIDPSKEQIPVRPVAHFTMGGKDMAVLRGIKGKACKPAPRRDSWKRKDHSA